jgi:hypothetical protein
MTGDIALLRPTIFTARKAFTLFLEQILRMLRARMEKNQVVFRRHTNMTRNSNSKDSSKNVLVREKIGSFRKKFVITGF